MTVSTDERLTERLADTVHPLHGVQTDWFALDPLDRPGGWESGDAPETFERHVRIEQVPEVLYLPLPS